MQTVRIDFREASAWKSNTTARMQYNDLLQSYFGRSDALQSYWTLYVVVIGGVLAFASLRQRPDLVTTSLVTILFAIFAYKNLGGIHDVTIQRSAILENIRESSSGAQANQINATLLAPDYPGVRNYHVCVDVLTVLALWAMERRRRSVAGRAVEAASAGVL